MSYSTSTIDQTKLSRKEGHITRMHDSLAQIEEIWCTLQHSWDQSTLNDLYRSTHALSSLASLHGFRLIGDAAHTLEYAIHSFCISTSSPLEEQQIHIRSYLERLRKAVEGVDLYSLNQHEMVVVADSTPWRIVDNQLVFLIEEDPTQANDLAQQIAHFGYTLQVFNHLDTAAEAISKAPPTAVIANLVFPNGNLAGAETITAIRRISTTSFPIIFTSARDDLEARLQAVRAGGNAYFTKPVDVGGLIDKLDELTVSREPEPYRILIVEDGLMMSAYYETVLRQANMMTVVVNDPLTILDPLSEFRPDLILMDMYMPGCSGLELAMVIRQQEAYVGIPIVFLSGETALTMQMAAMSQGGDDFLTKPITPEHLIASVRARVQRSRTLRSFMIRDSLTGLFNHTTTKAHLDIEMARAARNQGRISFAVIDLDHFKLVNDTYGHPTGDRVIKSLARLLQQRLRRSDIIGRYGGEEFAIVLPGADGPTAQNIFDDLRMRFAAVQQVAQDKVFSVTFSCGIATMPQYDNATKLMEAADKALYKAKNGGRNRVVLATEV